MSREAVESEYERVRAYLESKNLVLRRIPKDGACLVRFCFLFFLFCLSDLFIFEYFYYYLIVCWVGVLLSIPPDLRA